MPMPITRLLVAALIPGLCMGLVRADKAEEEAIEKITKLGGAVVRDEKAEGKPILVVELSRVPAGAKELKELKHLKHFKRLRKLTLPEGSATDGLLKTLRELALLRTLSQAEAAGDGRPTKDAEVVSVDLRFAKITDAGLRELKDFKNLRELNLSSTKVTDAGLKELKLFKNLQRLALGGTGVTNAGLK